MARLPHREEIEVYRLLLPACDELSQENAASLVGRIEELLREQAFAEVYIACRRRRPPEIIRDMRYVFAQVDAQRFFGYEAADVLGEVVQMATPERALLDALDRPRYAGGIGEMSRMVAGAAARLSWDSLLAALRQWNQSALVQRLGYLLELHQVELPPTVRKELAALVRPSSKVLLGARGRWGTSGQLATPWNVIVNGQQK